MSPRSLILPIEPGLLARVRAGLLRLNASEFAVLQQMILGHTHAEIALNLGLKEPTIHTHILKVLRKTGSTRYETVRAAFELKDDPEVIAYFKGLPPKRVRKRPPVEQ